MTANEWTPEPTHRGWFVVFAVVLGIVGLLMAHHPMIFTGLREMQVDLGDARLINYLLEHNYQWYRGDPLHRDFWNPPIFYPARNIGAYTDTMLGIAPLYAMFRVVSFAPDTSFQLWMITLSLLNYAVMFHFARSRIHFSIIGSSVCAFLFAFGSPRMNMMVQQTQLTQFLSLITIDALFGLFTDREGPWLKRLLLWLVATAGMLAQLSSGYYLGWFTVFSLGLAVLVALSMQATRMPCLSTIWRDAPWITLSAILGVLAMRPWLIHHLEAAKELGPRFFGWVTLLQPHPRTWLYTGSYHWIGNWVTKLTGFPGFVLSAHDTPLGVGLTTTLVGLVGLSLAWNLPAIRMFTIVAALLFLSITRFSQDLVSIATYLLILVPITVAYTRRVDERMLVYLVVSMMLIFLVIKVNPRVELLSCGIYTLVLAIAVFIEMADDWQGRFLLGALIVALSYSLSQSWFCMAMGFVCGALTAGASFALGARSHRWLEAMLFGGFLCFVGLITYVDRPMVLVFGLGAMLVVLLTSINPVRLPSRFPAVVLMFGLVLAVVFEGGGSAWHSIYLHIPGASSLLFVSRIGLMLLIPWAIGVGYFFDQLLVKNRRVLALALGTICVLEQGVTTISYDKYANREFLAALSRRIDPNADAFYYSPHNAQYAPFKANLDAMWAGLETGKPTINGYSGHTPLGWRKLEDSNQNGARDIQRLEGALDEWRRAYGHSVRRVQWIGGLAEGEWDSNPP